MITGPSRSADIEKIINDAWENKDRDDEFVWMRSFPNSKMRDKAIDAYYSSPEWLKIVDQIRPTIRRREVRIMTQF